MAERPHPEYAPHWEQSLVEGIKRERTAAGMTQAELAERMSNLGYRFHQATVYKIESGERKVTASEAWGIAEVLNIELEELFWSEAERRTPEARRRVLHTLADRVLQELLDLDTVARRLSHTHRTFLATLRDLAEDGITEAKNYGEEPQPIEHVYAPLAALGIQNEILWRLRHEIWTDDFEADFNRLAGNISGIVGLGPKDYVESAEERKQEIVSREDRSVVNLSELDQLPGEHRPSTDG